MKPGNEMIALLLPDTPLDDSERDLIRRTIESVNKDPRDPDTLREYIAAWLRLRRALKFAAWQPEPGTPLA
jgi:hypothetical protein